MTIERAVNIIYRNWKGDTRVRAILPIRISFENSEYHPDTQWILIARDCEDNTVKEFALKDILWWGVGA